MRDWMRRISARKVLSALTLAALLAAESSASQVRPRHEEQISAPEHSHVLADPASTKRPLTLAQHRSLFTARASVLLPTNNLSPPRLVSRVGLRREIPLPPARMRYRRSTHDADGEPPA